jgi:hypothetical protein
LRFLIIVNKAQFGSIYTRGETQQIHTYIRIWGITQTVQLQEYRKYAITSIKVATIHALVMTSVRIIVVMTCMLNRKQGKNDKRKEYI